MIQCRLVKKILRLSGVFHLTKRGRNFIPFQFAWYIENVLWKLFTKLQKIQSIVWIFKKNEILWKLWLFVLFCGVPS